MSTALDDGNVVVGPMERRFDGLDRKIDGNFHTLNGKIDLTFDRLDNKMSRQFIFLVGIILTSAAGIATAVLTR